MKDFTQKGLRLFNTHSVRKTVCLTGKWFFTTPENFFAETEVPTCWERYPSLANYRGKGTYTKEVEVERDGYLRFYFEGVSFFARVYFDGRPIGKHYNAYTPFSVVTPYVLRGKHVLKVVVDNRYGFRSALHVPNDYYSYGGITRGVQMEYVGKNYLDSVTLFPEKKGEKWSLRLRVDTIALEKSVEATIECLFGGERRTLGTIKTGAEKEFLLDNLTVEEWSPKSPRLYETTVFLITDEEDDLTERVGFRTVEAREDGFFVGGEKIFLQGVNRHENYNEYGAAVPFAAMKKDLELIVELGANFIRTCHYPNDSLFLDACDELGLLVWEESHSRGLTMWQMKNPLFMRQLQTCGREMIKYHASHPSIVIWGCLNECADTTLKGRRKYKKHIDLIRSLDKSRPVTFASCTPFRTRTLDLEDIVSYNCYFGWTNKKDIETGYPEMYDWIRKQSGTKGKPILISEFGAGAIFGKHGDEKNCEESQAEILRKSVAYYKSRPEIIGICIWQFADVRVDQNYYYCRPEGIAREGLVDRYRRKKKSYFVVQKAYKGE